MNRRDFLATTAAVFALPKQALAVPMRAAPKLYVATTTAAEMAAWADLDWTPIGTVADFPQFGPRYTENRHSFDDGASA